MFLLFCTLGQYKSKKNLEFSTTYNVVFWRKLTLQIIKKMNVWSSYQHVYSGCLWCILSIIDPIFYQLKKGGGYFFTFIFLWMFTNCSVNCGRVICYHVYLKEYIIVVVQLSPIQELWWRDIEELHKFWYFTVCLPIYPSLLVLKVVVN